MERMTLNLRQALEMQLLSTPEAKRFILLDILTGIGHLHARNIVHRDIKPENVLLLVVGGDIIGPAKVCDFSVSRKAQDTDMLTSSMRTSAGLAGTLAYLPPEVFIGSAGQANNKARDIWSFGVLMCEVLEPDFLKNLVRVHPVGIHSLVRGTEFAKKLAKRAQSILCDWVLDHIVISCLFLDPALLPDIKNLRAQMVNDGPHDFNLNDYSRQYKRNEVLRYVRKWFPFEYRTNNLETAISVLKESVHGKSDFRDQRVLAYCHYYGIGIEKNEEKAIELFESMSDAGDRMSMSVMGDVHREAGRFESAISLIKKSVKLGSATAMVDLANCYLCGNGVEKDMNMAFQLASSAAKAGCTTADFMLAMYFIHGVGTKKDERRAWSLLAKVYASGDPESSMELALLYKEGRGVRKDEKNSDQLVVLARKRGYVGSLVKNKQNEWIISPE